MAIGRMSDLPRVNVMGFWLRSPVPGGWASSTLFSTVATIATSATMPATIPTATSGPRLFSRGPGTNTSSGTGMTAVSEIAGASVGTASELGTSTTLGASAIDGVSAGLASTEGAGAAAGS